LSFSRNRKLKELRKEHEEYIREKREEALQAQELVKDYVAKRVKEEESKNGELSKLYQVS